MLFEAYYYLGWARVLKKLPFSKVAPTLGIEKKETPLAFNQSDKETAHRVSLVIHIMSRYTLWESQCLVKAIAGMKMLEKRNIDSTLYLGTAKDESGKFVAHAWLRSGPYFISGSEGMEKFTVVAKYAKSMNRVNVQGETYG
ncbi:lasso peptide biosynthesis B2 protein [Alteribacter populi]|uniref:lasso peptide biosynthesis B2 protein n=1 Tax=Alteribacter populi TaxID=2011011 RepID=UPI000BBA6F8B|nr:lasso peptide biosynthesis B2 protein [Alteribacter populi]